MLDIKLFIFIVFIVMSIIFAVNSQTDLNIINIEKEKVLNKDSRLKHDNNTLNQGACMGCHGETWDKIALSKSRNVSKMTSKEISDALIGFKKGTYGGDMRDLMKAQVEKYSDEELIAFANDLSKKYNPASEQNTTQEVISSTINSGACTGCHGVNLDKSALGKSKVVSSMSYDEIVIAMIGYKNGTYGRDMKNLMKAQVEKYSDDELKRFAKSINK